MASTSSWRCCRRASRSCRWCSTSSGTAAPTGWCWRGSARPTRASPSSSSGVSRSSPHGRLARLRRTLSLARHRRRAAFAEAFELLYGLGHRHFGLVTIDRADDLPPPARRGPRRRHRADAATRVSGSAPPPRRASTAKLAGRGDPPAAGTPGPADGGPRPLRRARARGARGGGAARARVPRDLSVDRLRQHPAAAHAPPGLTTFDAVDPRLRRARSRACWCGGSANPQSAPETRLVSARLVPRGSHGPAPDAERGDDHRQPREGNDDAPQNHRPLRRSLAAAAPAGAQPLFWSTQASPVEETQAMRDAGARRLRGRRRLPGLGPGPVADPLAGGARRRAPGTIAVLGGAARRASPASPTTSSTSSRRRRQRGAAAR